VAINHRVRSEMSGNEEKIDGSDYNIREWYAPENPRAGGCVRG
jgi:hypothetical protein